MKNIYTKYTFEDFIEDDDFIMLAKNNSEDELINLLKDCTPEAKEDAVSARNLIINLGADTNHSINTHHLFESIKATNAKQEKPLTPKITKVRYLRWAAAASLLLLVSVIGLQLYTGNTTTKNTGHGYIATETLPDGSVVTLNSNSNLSYSKKDWEGNRKLNLEGEAFFEVEKGSRFVVNTAFGEVAVLGTSFNVYARDGQLDVICMTGKVSVKNKDKSINKIILAGERATIDNGTLLVKNTVDRSDWQNKKIYYDNAPIETILAEMENQFNKKFTIKAKDLSKYNFTGVLSLESEEKAMENIKWPFRLETKITKDEVIFLDENQ